MSKSLEDSITGQLIYVRFDYTACSRVHKLLRVRSSARRSFIGLATHTGFFSVQKQDPHVECSGQGNGSTKPDLTPTSNPIRDPRDTASTTPLELFPLNHRKP